MVCKEGSRSAWRVGRRCYTTQVESSPISLAQAVVLALIQGVTEFLPISSSAHLVLPSALTDWPDQGLAFDVAVHLGTLAAVLCYFRRELAGFARSGWTLVARRQPDENLHLFAKIALATVPLAIAGVAFADLVETRLRRIEVIALATMGFGVALWLADWRGGETRAETPSYPQAILIGLAQALAIIPGASRSGVTIAAALALGLGRGGAARFSFLLAIPAITGAAVLMARPLDAPTHWPPLLVGFFVAAASAWVCVAFFVRFVERTGMTPYVIYRIALGSALLLFI